MEKQSSFLMRCEGKKLEYLRITLHYLRITLEYLWIIEVQGEFRWTLGKYSVNLQEHFISIIQWFKISFIYWLSSCNSNSGWLCPVVLLLITSCTTSKHAEIYHYLLGGVFTVIVVSDLLFNGILWFNFLSEHSTTMLFTSLRFFIT